MARSHFLPAAIAAACYAVEPPRAVHSAASMPDVLQVPHEPASGRALGAEHSTARTSWRRSAPALIAAPVHKEAERHCPPEMAEVQRPQGAFCIDRWEATLTDRAGQLWPHNQSLDRSESPAPELVAVSAPGRIPQGYISGAQAARACRNAGKRLCEFDEWTHACRGSRGYQHPYGNERRVGACNEPTRSGRGAGHPVVLLFERFAKPGTDRSAMWSTEWMNDPRLHEMPSGVEPTGSRSECRSEAGAFDMVGNLHEWVADTDGTFLGGFFLDTTLNGEGCGYRTRAHDFDYHDYSTGFRCCADAVGDPTTRLTAGK